MNIQTDRQYMIFKQTNDYGTFYSVGLSRKNQDGTYTNGYMPVKFKKDVAVEDKTKIKIKKAWLDFYKNNQKATVPYIFISEFEVASELSDTDIIMAAMNEENPFSEVIIDDDDLPF